MPEQRDTKPTLLLVDDDVASLEDAALVLSGHFDCTTVSDPEAVLDAVKRSGPDAVLLDLCFDGRPLGHEILSRLSATHPDLPVIMWTEAEDDETLMESLARGAFHTVKKTASPARVLALVEAGMRRRASRESGDEVDGVAAARSDRGAAAREGIADAPILEFDPSRSAVIEAAKYIRPIDAPEHCVACFFAEVIDSLRDDGRAREIGCMRSEMGRHPLYEMDVYGERLALYHPGLTAPFAAAMLEEVIALGCRKFVACGGAGVLDREIAVGHPVVATAAVRDEGSSYHYMPAGREVDASPEAVAALENVLMSHGLDFVKGKTWTTDAIYRETKARVAARRAEGCLTVEMEAAAFFAVARFRSVVFGQILYGGDDVSGAEWDTRDWHRRESVRERLFWLAAEACLKL